MGDGSSAHGRDPVQIGSSWCVPPLEPPIPVEPFDFKRAWEASMDRYFASRDAAWERFDAARRRLKLADEVRRLRLVRERLPGLSISPSLVRPALVACWFPRAPERYESTSWPRGASVDVALRVLEREAGL